MWLGYLEDYHDYMTQGQTIKELQENLKDIYGDLTDGHIPGVRKAAELQIAWSNWHNNKLSSASSIKTLFDNG